MLHKMSRLKGAHIEAKDGEIGHIDDFLIEEGGLTVRYMVVDTSNWIGGKWVAISPTLIRNIDWEDLKVKVDVTRDALKNSPELESLDVPTHELVPFVFI